MTQAAPITGVSATTTMPAGLDMDIANTVNGTGLSAYELNASHDLTSAGNSWVGSGTTGAITFDLKGTHSVEGFTVWNQNNSGSFNRAMGIRDVLIEYSVDGVSYQPLSGAPAVFQAGGLGGPNQSAPPQPQIFSFTAVTASFIRITVHSNYGHVNYTGFAEIMFDGTRDGKPPELVAYQGYLVDSTGKPLGTDAAGNAKPANFNVIFRIYTAVAGGSPLWTEQQTVTIDKGYFSVRLGEGSAVDSDPRPSFSSVFKGADATERFIGISVQFVSGGAFDDILPRLQLLSAPYAFLASQARSLVSPDGSPLITAGTDTVTIAGNLDANLLNLDAGRITSGTINNARIQNLAAGKITSGTFNAARIPNLDAGKITSGTIDNARISLTAMDVPFLDAGKITSGTIDNARISLTAGDIPNLGAGKITSGTFDTDRIANSAITDAKIAGVSASKLSGTLSEAQIADGAITLDKLATASVGNNKLVPLSIGGGKIQDGAISDIKISSVSAAKITGTLSEAQITDGAVTKDKIASDSIGSGKIIDGGVQTVDIKDGAVTDSKIASVNTTKLTGAITVDSLGRVGVNNRFDNVTLNVRKVGDSSDPVVVNVELNSGADLFQVQQNGKVWAQNSFITGSDERLKNSITSLGEVMPRILQLNPSVYRLNTEGTDGPLHIGFIAQEVQSLFPDTVSTNGEYLALSYAEFGPIAIKAIQEQQARIDELKADVAALKAAVEALQAAGQ